MKTTTEKTFDTMKFFTEVKRQMSERMIKMSLSEIKDFLRQVREGKIKFDIR